MFAAIGATNALSMLFLSMCIGAAIGVGVVVSQYSDAGDSGYALINGGIEVAARIILAIGLQRFHLSECGESG